MKANVHIFHSMVFEAEALSGLREDFSAIADVTYHQELVEDPAYLKRIAAEADIVIANDIALAYDDLKDLPRLKMICLLGSGYDMIQLEDMVRGNVAVCNAPTYGTENVAQHALAMIFALAHRIGDQNQRVAESGWDRARPGCIGDFSIYELQGRTLGLVGYGNIARRLKEMLAGFGMKVLAYSSQCSEKLAAEGVESVSLEELFSRSDIVSIHTRDCPENAKMINARLFDLMKPESFLINTARGGLIDEEALIAALQERKLAGAGLDVLTLEPPSDDHTLLKEPNCILTPHIAWNSPEARQRLAHVCLENVKDFLVGGDFNRVN